MNKIKSIFALLALSFVLSTGVMAQQDTGTMGMSNSVTDNNMNTEGKNNGTRYIWIAFVAVIGAGIIAAVVIRSRRSKDDRPQTGGDINNPASGI